MGKRISVLKDFWEASREKIKEIDKKTILSHVQPIINGAIRWGSKRMGKGNVFVEEVFYNVGESVYEEIVKEKEKVDKPEGDFAVCASFFNLRKDITSEEVEDLMGRYYNNHLILVPYRFFCKEFLECLKELVDSMVIKFSKTSKEPPMTISSIPEETGDVYFLCERDRSKFIVHFSHLSTMFDKQSLTINGFFQDSDAVRSLIGNTVTTAVNMTVVKYFKDGSFYIDEDYSGKPRITEIDSDDDIYYIQPEELEETFLWVKRNIENREDYSKLGLKTSYGLLLYGKPGSGKTSFVRNIHKRISGITTLIISSGVGNESILSRLSYVAKEVGTILFVWDDCENRMQDRDSGEDISSMLSFLDGFQTCEGAIHIALTNRVGNIDEAFRRSGRFDRCIEVTGMTKEEHRKLSQDMFRTTGGVCNKEVLEYLITRNYNDNAHMRSVVDECLKLSLASKNGMEITEEIVDKAYSIYNIYTLNKQTHPGGDSRGSKPAKKKSQPKMLRQFELQQGEVR